MSRKVVHDDDVMVVEHWSQTLFDVCEEDRPVHRPIDHERCDHPVVAQSDNQGDGLPMAVGNGPDQSFPARATAPKSHQAGAGGEEWADVARARRRWIRKQGLLDPARLVFIDETARVLPRYEAVFRLRGFMCVSEGSQSGSCSPL